MAPLEARHVLRQLRHLSKRVYDPRHIGLFNLVLDLNDISRLLPSDNHGHRSAPVPKPFLETIEWLQGV
jgi:hypothetical protein